jgi:phosphohistidine swiveling domain-containing protein
MISLTTKADTLKSLESTLKTAKVLPQICFTISQWSHDRENVLAQIRGNLIYRQNVIIRSSGIKEDSLSESLAGHFTSIGNVYGEAAIIEAVEKVIESFGDAELKNQVFIQPMLLNVTMSGVAFSRDPANGSEYIIINYDDTSGSTSSVTSGSSNSLQTFYVWKEKIPGDLRLAKVVNLVLELETLLKEDSLDIEFGFSNEELYLFQVRKLILKNEINYNKEEMRKNLRNIKEKISILAAPHPFLFGKKSVFGVMPDWNPAEIIGIRPRPLALSFYKEIITDNIWAYQRDNYGYKNLRSFPLLVHFYGLPYIDVRVSFNSFLPADLSPEISEKLINYYINRLVETPSHHDKVEFEIIFSCYTFDLTERIRVLRESGFTEEEIKIFSEKLRILTNRIINGETGLWKKDIEKVKILEERRSKITNSNLDKISKLYWLIEDCKRYGTLPFAGLARAGFIAVQILKSLVTRNILSVEEYDDFMGSLDTVSSHMGNDFEQMSKMSFLEKYGHLRPGTYDILSARYDEAPEKYFEWNLEKETSTNENKKKSKRFLLSLDQLKSIEKTLLEHGLDHNVIGLFDFIKAAIEGREYSKFVFTRNLSEALTLMQQVGEEFGFTKEEVSYLDFSVIPKLYSGAYSIQDLLKVIIEENKAYHQITCSLQLPPLIIESDDVYSFHIPNSEPNFITLGKTTGEIAFITNENADLDRKILFIPSADPGYDWIFSRGINGFITMYGGANSHMAIRAGELSIPAVIGAGEILYNRWSKANLIQIDCSNRQVFVLK